jgi:Domain of unknown function (DUF222)
MGEVTGRLDPEATERALTVLDALAQKAGDGDDRTAAQRRADAFDTMCKAWLASGDLPAPADGAPRRDHVIVTIPYQTLLGLPGAPTAVLGDGTLISAETARRLACDAPVRRVVCVPPAGSGTCSCGHTCSSAAALSGTSDLGTGPGFRGSIESAHGHARPAGTADRGTATTCQDQAVSAAALNGPPKPGSPGPSADVPSARPGNGSHVDVWPGSRDPTARLAAILRKALASLPPPLGARSAVLDAGRATPTFTAAMKHALHAEFGGRCAFPRCGKRATVSHHVVHWARGGRTSVANGAPLCEFHHFLVHEGGWHLGKDRHGVIRVSPPPPAWPGPRRRWRNGRPIDAGPSAI